MRTPVEILAEQGFLDWRTIWVGRHLDLVTNDDAVAFAIDWLVANRGETDETIILLAGGYRESDKEIRSLLDSIVQKRENLTSKNIEECNLELDKWRYARLKALDEMQLDWLAKTDQLQHLYAEFGYPGDMESCCIYATADASSDPLLAMKNAIWHLQRRISLAKRDGVSSR